MTRPLMQDKYRQHWRIQEVSEWPRDPVLPWRDLKRESIQEKLLALKRRGKGPLARMAAAADMGKAKGKKRK